MNFCQERDFDLIFCQERDFQANKSFLQKIRKGAPKMAGDREKKNDNRSKMGGDGLECLGKTFALRGLEELFFQLCCCVSFWFWQEIGFGFTYIRTLLNNFFWN